MQYIRHFLEDPAWGGFGNPEQAPGTTNVIVSNFGNPYPTGSESPVMLDIASQFLGDRCFLLAPFGFSGNARRGTAFDVVTADPLRADVEQLAQFGATLSHRVPFLGARCSQTTPVLYAGYFADVRFSANQIAVTKGAAGVTTDIAVAAFAFTPGKRYRVRFSCIGTALKMRVWEEGTAEPAAWGITTSDATISAAGYAVVGVFGNDGDNSVPPDFTLFYYTAGTGGDTAPDPPISRADYLEFLALPDALRCVLLEIDTLGQLTNGNAAPGRVCVATMPFVSRPWDYPYQNQCYEELVLEAPEFRRRLDILLRGRSTQSFGDAILQNEVPDGEAAGRLDPWLTWNWDGRDVRQLLGSPTWRRCDFRVVMRGTTQDIYKPGRGRLGFKLRGREAVFQRPFQEALIGGAGPNAGALLPGSFGFVFNIPLVPYDPATFTYTIEDPLGYNPTDLSILGYKGIDIRDAGGSLLIPEGTIASADPATDTITASAPHNLPADCTVMFAPIGNLGLPAGLGFVNKYYVLAAGLTSTDFRVSTTKGGTPVNITATGVGAFVGRLFDVDDTNKRVTLRTKPVGQVTMDLACFAGSLSFHVFWLWRLRLRLFNDFDINAHNQWLSTYGATMGIYVDEQRSVGDVFDELLGTAGFYWTLLRTGVFRYGRVDFPPLTPAVAVFDLDDTIDLTPKERYLPAEVERAGYKANNTVQKSGLLTSVTAENLDLYGKPFSIATYTPVPAGLDQPANHILRRTLPVRETLFRDQADAQAEIQRSFGIFGKTCGTFVFDAGADALDRELGDVVTLRHPRYGFHNGRDVVIVGLTENAQRGKVEVEVFTQIDGAWPVVTSTAPNVSEVYF